MELKTLTINGTVYDSFPGSEESIIPVETVLAEGTVVSGAAPWGYIDTGVTIAMLNQYRRIRLAIKGASNVSNFWAFQFSSQRITGANRIANASGVAVTLQKINDRYFRVESLENRGTDTALKGMVVESNSWLSVMYGSLSPAILDLTSYSEETTLKIAPVNTTTIDYSWAVCGYNC